MNEYYPSLFSAIRIGSLTLKNRIMASPISLFDLSTTPEHKHSLNEVSPADCVESAEECVKKDDRRSADHGPCFIETEYCVEKISAGNNT